MNKSKMRKNCQLQFVNNTQSQPLLPDSDVALGFYVANWLLCLYEVLTSTPCVLLLTVAPHTHYPKADTLKQLEQQNNKI